jgi:hypothetical protein
MSDRVVPSDVDTERALLGALLIAPDQWPNVCCDVTADSFYEPRHGHVFEAIRRRMLDGGEIDTTTVADELRRVKLLEVVGGTTFLVDLMASTPAIRHAGRYARIVDDLARRREGIFMLTDAVERAYTEPDIDVVLVRAQTDVVELLRRSAAHAPEFVALSSVDSKALRWLWRDQIPLGEICLVAGYEKAGKSTLMIETAARITRGQLPGDLAGVPSKVLFLTREDRIAQVVKPRFQAAGANLDLVLVEAVDDARSVTPERIERACRDGVRFVVLDPLPMFLDALSERGEREDLTVRQALGPFVEVAQQHEASIGALKHLNKSDGRRAFDRVSGSRAYTAAARSLLFVADDPEEEHVRVMYAKGNLVGESAGSRYRIEATPVVLDDGAESTAIRIVWAGSAATGLDDALNRTKADERSTRPRDEAMAWLVQLFTDHGPRILATDVQAEAEAAGIAPMTLRRAREDLGVEPEREGFGKAGRSWWKLDVGSMDDH